MTQMQIMAIVLSYYEIKSYLADLQGDAFVYCLDNGGCTRSKNLIFCCRNDIR